MEELPRSNFERTDSDTESSSEKKSEKKQANSSSVRRIGAFAKMTAEAPSAPVDRTEARKSFFEEKDSGPKDSSSSKEAAEVVEPKTEADEASRKVAVLQKELTSRIEGYQEVIDSTPEHSAEHIQAVAAKKLDESVKEKADNPDVEADPVIEAEFARQLAEIELPEEDGAEIVEDVPAVIEQESTEPRPEDDEDITASTKPVTPTAPATTSPPKRPPITATGATGSATPPPPPATRNTATPLPPLPPLPPINNRNVPPSPNVAPNTKSDSRNERYSGRKRMHPAASALVGYAIGRRGGRKRAERIYEPKVEALTQELDITKKHLEARELDLKKAATNTIREQQAEKYVRRPEKVDEQKKQVTEILRQTVMTPEQTHSALNTVEFTPDVAPVPKREASRLPEVHPTPQATPETTAIKRAEQLSTPALLKAAESLIIEGVSVRRMYETNKIDRNGLVAIVQEGLRGGNIVHAFEKVELGAEAQAGRAREFRHDDPSFSALATDDTFMAQTHSASSQLPNNPDLTSLQPINIPVEKSKHEAPTVTQPEELPVHKNPLLDPKTTEFKFAAVAAIAIALLILWAIF